MPSPTGVDCTVAPEFYTSDEKPDHNEPFPAFDASFHKLLEHDPETGLLTPAGQDDYRCLLKAMSLLRNDPVGNNDEVTDLLNALGLQTPYRPTLEDTCPEQNPPTEPKACCDDDAAAKRGNRVLINPRSGSSRIPLRGDDGLMRAFDFFQPATINPDTPTRAAFFDEYLSYRSRRTAAEMIEVYGKTMLRDIKLGRYHLSTDATVGILIDALNAFGDDFVWGFRDYGANGTADVREMTAATHEVTAENLFRGPTEVDPPAWEEPGGGAGSGPTRPAEYLSYFLRGIRPALFPSGCAPFVANLINTSPFADIGDPLRVLATAQYWRDPQRVNFVKRRTEYACLQNAEIPQQYPNGYFDSRKTLDADATGRHLGNYVHVDNVYEEYIRACDILTANQVARDPGSPYIQDDRCSPPEYVNEGDGPTLGPPDVWAILGTVRGIAERVAFAEKWFYMRRARPEVMARLIDLMYERNDPDLFPLDDSLKPNSTGPVREFLNLYKQWNEHRGGDGYLLPQMYPEGSPAHPAWPSGHATVAGACVTTLKAMFNGFARDFRPEKNDAGGDGDELDINYELDKLASNVALGRDFGGGHFRSDGEHGILIGEQIALSYLEQIREDYVEEPLSWTVQLRNYGIHQISAPEDVEKSAAENVRSKFRSRSFAPPSTANPSRQAPGRYGKANL